MYIPANSSSSFSSSRRNTSSMDTYSNQAASTEASAGNSGASVNFARAVQEAFVRTYGKPTLAKASVRQSAKPDVVGVDLVTSQRDFTNDVKRKVSQSMTLWLHDGQADVLADCQATDISSEVSVLQSPTDSSLRAVLRASKEKSGCFVEIWRDGVLASNYDVSAAHGQFYGDETFGSLAWSNDNSYLLYAAEKPEYAKAKTEDKSSSDYGLENDGSIGDEITGSVAGFADPRRYQLDEDWGETFNGKKPPVLVALRVADGDVRILTSPEGVSPGQALFLPGNDHRIAFVGYAHGARKPGLVYCQNRPSGLFISSLLDSVAAECVHNGAVRSPRLTPSGRALVFISTAPGGPHAATSALMLYNLATRSAEVVVPVIDHPSESPQVLDGTHLPAGFPGLFVNQLPHAPWLGCVGNPSRELLALTTIWRSTYAVVTVDLLTRHVQRHTPVDGTASAAVLGCAGDLLAASFSTPGSPSTLSVGRLEAPAAGEDSVTVQWHRRPAAAQENLLWNVVPSKRGITEGDVQSSCESIFVYPAQPNDSTKYFWHDKSQPRPLVVMPHGGPHSTYTLDYNPLVAGLVRMGFGVLLVNFTGSLGFGQSAVLAQIGRMDTLSLTEIQDAAAAIHAAHNGDPKRTVYLGGSYSGYTGALLAARVPGFYRGIVLRNPVIAVADNAAMSDIPDWCWAELGLPYSFDAPPALTPEIYKKMWAASPSSMVDAVRDPILLMLGASDRRVPPPQSKAYYSRLKAAGKPVQCRVYPNVGHPLDSVEAERDSFVSIARFYAKSLDDSSH
ncbi:hypothetical protein FB645_003348 [Coemansia sp. IMI 203386]|nr:hypothetical protein FB645_003348 [Coemansia sp. IMI 203386]